MTLTSLWLLAVFVFVVVFVVVVVVVVAAIAVRSFVTGPSTNLIELAEGRFVLDIVTL